MNKFLSLLLLTVSFAFGQGSTDSFFNGNPSQSGKLALYSSDVGQVVLLTDQIYWESQVPEVQKLKHIQDPVIREKTAEELAKAGHKIDVPIMVWAWDAYKVMKVRQDYGYTWVPSALQPPVPIAPQLSAPGLATYDPANPPQGSIKVSTLAKDYPKYEAPKPIVQEKSPVGPQSFGNLYLTVAGDTSLPDTIVKEPRGTFRKVVKMGPFGAWAYWEKIE